VGSLYGLLAVAEAFHLGLEKIQSLHRWDLAAMQYWLAMRNHREREAMERSREAWEEKRRFQASLPRQLPVGRRR
jgi:hypothetical protein